MLYKENIRFPLHKTAAERADALGRAAHDAAVAEIMTAPKPGLVDPLGSGCHSDMDWNTFMRSADAIAPFWSEQAAVGLDGAEPETAMGALRSTGIKMEDSMLTATEGINTHKGLIYLMSLLLYGAGFCIHKKSALTPRNIAAYASRAVKGSVDGELRSLKGRALGLTHGEKLFLEHGVTGVRGEAENAFPCVLKHGLPELERALSNGATRNNAMLAALLAIMLNNEDSNVIYRGGFDYWRGAYRESVREAKRLFDPLGRDYSPLVELEKSFMPLRISPGGAADLLSCTFFIHNVTSPTCQH